ncbi:hypothetical protein JXC34_06475 [Candidatus Woesearchaeota archaeon]|nr:hypothetical protein [Candidatus Woesearchaeota archaeon]
MELKAVIIVLCAFSLGIFSTIAASYYYPIFTSERPASTTTTYVIANEDTLEDDSNIITRVLGLDSEEKISPYDRIGEENIHVYHDQVVINIQNAQWARFSDTNSMDPVIDDGANAIEIIPEKPEEIHAGDIVSYQSEYAEGTIIHRVIETGYDEKGWYALMKGDNNPRQDPGKIRFSQIRRLVVAIIY